MNDILSRAGYSLANQGLPTSLRDNWNEFEGQSIGREGLKSMEWVVEDGNDMFCAMVVLEIF